MSHTYLKSIFTILVSVALMSCGGGGGSNDSSYSSSQNEAYSSASSDQSQSSESSYSSASELPASQSVSITVGVQANSNGSGNVYVIDGVQKKSLNLLVGNSYTFSYPSVHPFRISTTSDGSHNSGTVFETGVEIQDDTITIAVSESFPDKLYYFCSSHTRMGGELCINQTESDIANSSCSE